MNKTKRKCKRCNKIFYNRNYQSDKPNTGIYCSMECSRLSRRNGKYIKCKLCKKELYVTPSILKYESGKYCRGRCTWIAKGLKEKWISEELV